MHTFCTIVQIVNCQQIFIKSDPNLTFTFCPNRKSKFNILKNHISTTARGKFIIFAPLYKSLIVIKYVSKVDPNLTFSSSRTPSVCQYKHQSLVIIIIIISQYQEGGGVICFKNNFVYKDFSEPCK